MNSNGNNDYKSQSIQIDLLFKIQQIIFNITQENLETSIEKTMELFDFNFPYSYNLIISNLVYSAFLSKKDLNDFYINYIKLIQTKEEKINKNYPKIIQIFGNYLSKNESQESYYLIEKMLEENLIDEDIVKNIKSKYFAHYKSEKENRIAQNFNIITKAFLNNFEELSKNNWELHKQLIKEGHNPNEIAKIIRNDEIDKLQEISSQVNFEYDQTIEPSLYEKCSFINEENVTLIDYAAFFGSVKCFKYLLMNGADAEYTGKYAIAGGNEEIIHLCEQNHSSFENAYETAIEFHRNDIFKYLYENKIQEIKGLDVLGKICILYCNYVIFSYLKDNGMEIDETISKKSARFGNIYLVKLTLQNNKLPKSILFESMESENVELVEYILEQEGIDINDIDNEHKEIPIIYASKKDYIEIVKLLIKQKGININAQNDSGMTALICASSNGYTEIVKLFLKQDSIDVNVKDNIYKRETLLWESFFGHIETVKLLLEKEGIDVNVKDDNGQTALILASLNNHPEIIKILLQQKGININIKDNYGRTALLLASIKGCKEIIKLLLEQEEIDINAKDNNGNTALILASLNGHLEIVKLLLEQKGIDINAKDNYGKTAFDKATVFNRSEIIKLFREKHSQLQNEESGK